ncbi:hypothetical protein OG607_18845 [Streptomyces sp. NBC_01537]|uniref:hypothetical protein n=1 Tax=Streptomyces sp. NBC_01537 TaxID=2903896 RepID=UPI00386352E0
MMRNLSHRRLTRLLMTVLTTALMGFGISIATTPAAYAASCTAWSPSANGEGAAIMNISTHLKNNEYSTCDNVASISLDTEVYLRCYATNSKGNVWWYVRIANGTTLGWTSEANLDLIYYDDNLDGHMDYYHC